MIGVPLLAFFVSFCLFSYDFSKQKLGECRISDMSLSGPQKFHAVPMPRLGGVGLMAWAFGGSAFSQVCGAIFYNPCLNACFSCWLN